MKKSSEKYVAVSVTPFTKREVFALRIACAMLSNPHTTRKNWWNRLWSPLFGEEFSTPLAYHAAVREADKLLNELNKIPSPSLP